MDMYQILTLKMALARQRVQFLMKIGHVNWICSVLGQLAALGISGMRLA